MLGWGRAIKTRNRWARSVSSWIERLEFVRNRGETRVAGGAGGCVVLVCSAGGGRGAKMRHVRVLSCVFRVARRERLGWG